jgi:SAM-dependent methyltransferase
MNFYICRICNNSVNNETVFAKELNIGFRDQFEYFKCSACGCLQISEFPENINKYYPDYYYSFNEPTKKSISLKNRIKQYLRIKLYRKYLGRFSILGIVLSLFYENPLPWLNKQYFSLNSKILDVGCGNGELLKLMHKIGFKFLTGVDPRIKGDISYSDNFKITKGYLNNITGTYDLIMLHHSMEHIENQSDLLNDLFQRLNYNGIILIRIPVCDSLAYRKYGKHWSGLDAPRHYYLHTTNSLNLILNKAGFKIEKIIYDSTDFQFVVSEKYIRDIHNCSKEKIFSKREIRNFKNEAKRLNMIKDGDWTCFFCRKELIKENS